ncbi:hypothetical protein CEXT_215161, partial [Caerostris extrusa]
TSTNFVASFLQLLETFTKPPLRKKTKKLHAFTLHRQSATDHGHRSPVCCHKPEAIKPFNYRCAMWKHKRENPQRSAFCASAAGAVTRYREASLPNWLLTQPLTESANSRLSDFCFANRM